MLGVAREAWEAAGYEVRVSLFPASRPRISNTARASCSRTIASMEHSWGQGRDLLTARDVLVIDEAGMVWHAGTKNGALPCRRAGAKSSWSAIHSSCNQSRLARRQIDPRPSRRGRDWRGAPPARGLAA